MWMMDTAIGLGIRTAQTNTVRIHALEGCAEFPLLISDGALAELEQRALSMRVTIGHLIRLALGHYLAEVRDHRHVEGRLDDDRPDLTAGRGDLTVTLLLPLSRLAALEALAARRDTTAGTLIRHVVCTFLLSRSTGQQPLL